MDIKNIDKEKLSAFYGGAHEYLVMLNLYDSAVRLLLRQERESRYPEPSTAF